MPNDNLDYASRNRQRAPIVTHDSLLVILAGFITLAVITSVATPIFEGPDEIWHYAFADHLANGGGLPVFDVNHPATFLRDGAHPPLYYWIVAAVIAPIDRSDFPEQFHFNLASPKITPGGQSDRPNLLIHTVREDFPYHNAALAAHLARLISIALSVLTIIGVWKVAHRLLPDTCGKARSAYRRDRLAIAATALAAFVPQFVYGSAMINNDALAAATATWTLFALLGWMKDRSTRWTILSGAMLGLTLLSKIGMVVILPLPVIALVVSNSPEVSQAPSYRKNLRACVSWWLSSRQWKKIFITAGIIYISAFAIAGWWYIRNWALYGDPLAWKQWQALTGLGRVPPTIGDFIHDMIGLFGTFWADFSLRFDRTWVWVFGLLVLIALGGLVRRALRHDWPSIDWAGMLIALIWLGLLLVLLIRYSFTVYDVAGRALYPASAAIGVVLVVGWSGWNEIAGRRLIFGAIGGLVLLNLIAPFGIIAPAYAPPIVSTLPADVTSTSDVFGSVQLIGYRLKSNRVSSGDAVELETYWQKISNTELISPTYGVVALAQPGGTIVEHTDRVLGTDAYPSWAWQPDEIVETNFTVPVSVSASTLFNAFLSVRGIDNRLELGPISVKHNQNCQIDQSVEVDFGGLIKLIGYRIDQSHSVGVPTHVILCWQSIKPTPIDYTVFVHVTDANGGLVTADAQPRGGDYPTSVWEVGEQIEDSHPLPAAIGPAIKQVAIGLYRLDTGERLPLVNTGETEFTISNP